ISGASGTIRHTTNSGQTWTAQTSGTTNFLWSIHFTDGNNGWAMGDAGTIRHTTDGGAAWTGQNSGTASLLRTCSFVDANNGAAVGNSGTIVRTTGGATWPTQSSGTSNDLYGVSFVDAHIGWAVGVGGVILHTGKDSVFTSVAELVGAPTPASFKLIQNYPNPFNPSTEIQFSLPQRNHVTLTVFDLLGREVATLVSEELSAGSYSARWDATGFPSGVYFCRLQAGDFVETKKLVLVR
ncbi:MAG: T9SS type A sorting domain-containing protein, partial [Ignavibacteriales bacterium]|nr:T9SS type A sorting domain-containing protein [Ignavibacteriales bacterium]